MSKSRHQIKIRMTDDEYNRFKTKLNESGLTQQAFIICAIDGIRSTTPEELEQLRISNDCLRVICSNIRAIGNNINQIAKHANQYAAITPSDIYEMQSYIKALQKEANSTWRYSRLATIRLQPMRHLEQ